MAMEANSSAARSADPNYSSIHSGFGNLRARADGFSACQKYSPGWNHRKVRREKCSLPTRTIKAGSDDRRATCR